jgi:hypothetical protein
MKCAKCGKEIKDGQTYVMHGSDYFCPMFCAPKVQAMPVKRTIDFYAKCADRFWCAIKENGVTVGQYDGYPPKLLGDSDGVSMEIDLETGQIQNWVKPTEEDLKQILVEKKEE